MRPNIITILQLLQLAVANYDFIRDRGLLIKNETNLRATFIGTTTLHTTFLKIKQPVIPISFRFGNRCTKWNRNVHNMTTTLTQVLDQTLRERLKAHLFGTNTETTKTPPSTRAPETGLDYRALPKSVFIKPKLSSEGLSQIFHYSPPGIKVSHPSSTMNNIQSLGSTNIRSYIGFDCTRLTHVVEFNAIEPLRYISIILKTGTLAYKNFDFNIKLTTSTKSRATTSVCGPPRVYARSTSWPVVIWACDWQSLDSLDVAIVLSFQTKAICNNVRLSKVLVFPRIETINRHRRQAGIIVAGAAAAGGFIYSELSKWFRPNNNEIDKVKRIIKMEDAEGVVRDKEIQNLTKGVAFLANQSEQLVAKVHNELCQFETGEIEFGIEEFVRSLTSSYIEQIESTLIAISIPLDNNQATDIANILCRGINPESQDFCKPYYSSNENLKVISLHFENLDKSDEPITAAIKLQLQIPTLETYRTTIHRTLHVPVPLSKSSTGQYHFMFYRDIPQYFANFKTYERKISLTNCKRLKSVFYCNLNTLNHLFSSDSICLNTIFNANSSCALEEIQSSTNCFIATEGNTLLLSHVGDVNIRNQEERSAKDNVLDLARTGRQIKGSNITILSGDVPQEVTCSNARFTFRPISDEPTIIWERPLDYKKEENLVFNWNENNMKFWRQTDQEIAYQQSQMTHIQDSAIHEAIELKKVKNREKITDLIQTENMTYQNWGQLIAILTSALFLTYLFIRLLIFCRRGLLKCKESCCCAWACPQRIKGRQSRDEAQNETELLQRQGTRKSKNSSRSNTRTIYEVATT